MRGKQTSRGIVALLHWAARQNQAVKSVLRFILLALSCGVVSLPSQAAFSSLYVFGDGASSTTDGPGGASYFGRRYSNGRVWVEVLAQRQGLNYESNKNLSFFGHYSPIVVSNVNVFVPPIDVSSALFVLWIVNADFVNNLSDTHFAPYTTNNLVIWSDAMNLSLSNQFFAIQTLYNKGVRSLILPNAVDLTKIPYYVGLAAASKSFVRQRIIDYNLAFAARLNQARAAFTNLTIYAPDLFALLDDVVAHSASYGLTNALYNGQSVCVLDNPALANKALNGPGTNYIFWDYLDPTAEFHAAIADQVQQVIAPVHLGNLTSGPGTNQLKIENIPVGRDGMVETSSNCLSWTTVRSFTSSNLTQTVIVPAPGDRGFYRLRFPASWSWP